MITTRLLKRELLLDSKDKRQDSDHDSVHYKL